MLLTVIQGALPSFSGDNDLYDGAEFFAEFEELIRAVSADATQCLLLLRRSLRSTAPAGIPVLSDTGAGLRPAPKPPLGRQLTS